MARSAIMRAAVAAAAVATAAAALPVRSPAPTPAPTQAPPASCSGSFNTLPVYTGAPVLNATVPNGARYIGGNGTDTFNVVHLYGSPYEMGYAHGSLFRDDIPAGLAAFYTWVGGQVQTVVPWLPAWLADLVAEVGMPIALEWTFNNTVPFTPPAYVDEMLGIAAGAGVAAQDIFNINMVAELIKAQCTILGANGNATVYGPLAGGLAHLRTLDGMGGATMPIKDYATVFVYHPPTGPAVANFAWLTFIGTVTGMSQTVTVGEKYWNGQNDSIMSVAGEPWTLVNRALLAAGSLDDALAALAAANRTCAVMLGLGDVASGEFRGAQVAADAYQLFSWNTAPPYPQHPSLPGVVYWDKYSQPSNDSCLADLLGQYYGALDLDLYATTIAPLAQTGDLHAAFFDPAGMVAYYANAQKTYATDGGLYAYQRQFTRLDMAALFATPPPALIV